MIKKPTEHPLEQKNEEVSRKQKLSYLRQAGLNPYPERFEKQHDIADILMKADPTKLPAADKIETSAFSFVTAGRIMTIRKHGKLMFMHLTDSTARIQIAFSHDLLGGQFDLLSNFDLGDYIGIEGKLFLTHKGEITLMVSEFLFLGKALRPLPEKFHGLKDQETIYRQRYLDMLTNDEVKKKFKLRREVIQYIRQYLITNNFVEVETPVLSNTASGALAKPFVTHHNALDIDLYLRIAPETYLKRLIVGGYERVFEFARCFRNEGIDPSHLQEFTILEYYAAYWNWEDNLEFTEQLIGSLIQHIFGTYILELFGQEVDWKPPYPVITMRDLILEHSGIDIDTCRTVESLKLKILKLGIEIEEIDNLGYGNLVDSLYKKVARTKLIKPTFLIKHPIELSPLARANDEDPTVADRFQLVVNGWEIVNAYSELVDPIEQRIRLSEQSKLKAAGDEEAMMMDEEYIKAMEHGLPPVSGWGMGIDRLLALLTSSDNLKETVYFPLMRPKELSQSKTELREIEISVKEAGMTRIQAENLLLKYLQNDEYLYKHSLAVEAVMVGFAKRFGRKPEIWGLAGLLHDIDYPMTKTDPTKHGLLAEKILTQKKLHPEIIYAIKAHNHLHELSLDTLLARTLYSVEELTGLISACALVQPDKKLASVTLESLKKKFKQKSFAAGVNRGIIKKSEEYLDMSLDEVFALALSAMQGISTKLDL